MGGGVRRAAAIWASAPQIEHVLHELRLKGCLAEAGRAADPFEIQGVVTDVTDVADAAGFRRLEDEGVTDLITMPWAL